MAMYGLVAEWLCRGLQILVCRFDSDPSLQIKKATFVAFFFVFRDFLYLQNIIKVFNLNQ